MAVDQTKIPWTYTAAADVDFHTSPIPLARIECYNGGAVAGAVVVKDKSGGRELFRANVGAGEVASKTFSGFVEGIYIDSIMGSGRVDVYPRGSPYG